MFVLSRPAASPARTGDRVFDEAIDRLFGVARQEAHTPAMDASETDAAFRIVLDVPGVTREQLKVSIDGRRVSVTTAAPMADAAAAAVEGERALYRERRAARYARTVVLPAEVDQAASDAQLENGVLTLTLAKKARAGAAQLNVR